MIDKNDIYKTPKKLISERLSVVFAGTIAIFFLVAEIYAFLSAPENKKEVAVCVSNAPLKEAENNKSILETQTESKIEQTVIAKAEPKQETKVVKIEAPKTEEAKKEEVKTEQTVQAVEKVIIKNPIEEILALKDETAIWKMIEESKHQFSIPEQNQLLDQAITLDHVDNVEKMLDKGFVLTPPFYAQISKLISDRQYKMAMLLIEKDKVDLSLKNASGYTLLHEATAKGHQSLIRMIVSKGVDINVKADGGVSVLHYPCRFGYSITVQTLIELGIDINAKATLKYGAIYWNESTPLQIAARRGHTKLVALLLEAGADQNLQDGDGMTALDWARKEQKEDIVALLEPKNEASQESNNTITTLEEEPSSELKQ